MKNIKFLNFNVGANTSPFNKGAVSVADWGFFRLKKTLKIIGGFNLWII